MGTMQVEQWRPGLPAPPAPPIAMNFDELSMERSKSFVNALQELRNLRPQLYSAADYCQKSYLHNEQKQIVLDNLKNYAVGALVNAVDHLGTVAYKLTDLFEQQSGDLSKVELKISRLDQKILTSQHYIDIEGLRQQQLLAPIPRHHKHYILPSRFHTTKQLHTTAGGAGQNHITSTPHSQVVSVATKTLSWHLASESNSEKVNGAPSEKQDSAGLSFRYHGGSSKAYKATPEDFHLLDAVDTATPIALSLSVPPKFDSLETTTAAHHHNKGVLSGFFTKNKNAKQKKA